MSESSGSTTSSGEQLRIEGKRPLVVPWTDLPRRWQSALRQEAIGFECASGDWIEQDWTGVPVFELVDNVEFPEETTHVRLDAIDGISACVPISALDDAMIALAADEEPEDSTDLDVDPPYPRFVSSAVIGPRAIKRLSRIEPLSLSPGTDRNEYESLPKRDD